MSTEKGLPTYRRMLKSKLHRIAVTATEIDYEGSLSLDPALMAEADFLEFEEVLVANVANGARFTTYLIAGQAGDCQINGAAARLGQVGDPLIIMAFDLVPEDRAADWKPKVVVAG